MDDSVVIGRRNSMKRMLVHGIDATDVMTELGALDNPNAGLDNLPHLMKVVRERADAWIQKNFDRLGEEVTVRHLR